MIKTKKATLELEGGLDELRADLGVVIRGTLDYFAEKIGRERAEEEVRKAIHAAFMTEEELDTKTSELLKSICKIL